MAESNNELNEAIDIGRDEVLRLLSITGHHGSGRGAEAVCSTLETHEEKMSPDDFRHIALGMEGATESAHMGHPDFRANGKIFATLHTHLVWGMVKLLPDQQQRFVSENPATFTPENGAWGRAGCTKVRLDSVAEDTLGEAMTLAWQNTAKTASKRSKTKRTTKQK